MVDNTTRDLVLVLVPLQIYILMIIFGSILQMLALQPHVTPAADHAVKKRRRAHAILLVGKTQHSTVIAALSGCPPHDACWQQHDRITNYIGTYRFRQPPTTKSELTGFISRVLV